MPHSLARPLALTLLLGAASCAGPRAGSQPGHSGDPAVVALQATDLARFSRAHVAIVDTVVYWVAGPMGNPDRPLRLERLDTSRLPVSAGGVRLVAGARRRTGQGADSSTVYIARDTTSLEGGRVVRVTVVVEPFDSYGYFAQVLLERRGQRWQLRKISYFDA